MTSTSFEYTLSDGTEVMVHCEGLESPDYSVGLTGWGWENVWATLLSDPTDTPLELSQKDDDRIYDEALKHIPEDDY